VRSPITAGDLGNYGDDGIADCAFDSVSAGGQFLTEHIAEHHHRFVMASPLVGQHVIEALAVTEVAERIDDGGREVDARDQPALIRCVAAAPCERDLASEP
jgi:hypothetical protein